MAYYEQDRVYIRWFVGYGGIFHQADPRLEAAITATQSTAEGGTLPNSSTENFIKGAIYGMAASGSGSGVPQGPYPQVAMPATPALRGLIQIEANIARLDALLGANKVDSGEAEVDVARETARLRQEGRRLVHRVTRALGMKGPRANIFSSAPTIADADPFVTDLLDSSWRYSWPSGRVVGSVARNFGRRRR